MAEAFAAAPVSIATAQEAVIFQFPTPELEATTPDLTQPLGESAVDGFERVSTLGTLASSSLEVTTIVTDGGSWEAAGVADEPEPTAGVVTHLASRKSTRLTLVAGIAAGVFSMSAAPVAADTPPPSPTPSPTEMTPITTGGAPTIIGTKVVHHRSTIKPQKILNMIHNSDNHLSSGDFVQGNRKIVPNTAFMRESSAGFTTKCDDPYIVTWRNYTISEGGQGGHTCGPGPGPNGAQTTPHQFHKRKATIANVMENGTNHSTEESVRYIKGSSNAVTVYYKYNPTTPGNIKKITIYKNKPAAITETTEQ